jgi:hypothetical protein
MTVSNFPRSIPEIFTDVLSQFTGLIRKEGQLARAEISEKLTDLALGFGLLAGGAILLIPALVILLQAAVAGLVAANIPTGWASLIVGGIALVAGLILLAVAIGRLRVARPIPTKTIEQLQRDAAVARSQLRSDHDQSKRAA